MTLATIQSSRLKNFSHGFFTRKGGQSKGIYKGVKFAAKTATSPIALGLTAGFLGVKGLQKLGERKGLTFPEEKKFKKSIYRQQYDGRR